MKIKETIVVEGRDDLINLRRFVESEILITSGFGFDPKQMKKIDRAYEHHNLIIFTDPDEAGERIRRKLQKRYPKAKHAFVSREDATKKDNVGVENASVESLRMALERVRTPSEAQGDFKKSDLYQLGLIGAEDSVRRRDALGAILGIGYGNGKEFVSKLNHYGVSRKEFIDALRRIDE